MYLVRQLLDRKGHIVHGVGPDATVLEALEIMARHDVGALVVLDAQGELVGLVSERDYARKVVLKGRVSKDTPVREIMATGVVCVNSSQTEHGCMALMTNHRVRHIPVIDDGRLVGIISIGDVVSAIIEDQKFTIEQLEHYISGSR
ncbi:MAG: putative signal transduction protein with domain [Deltaproteobacteria bacterium]|nr:putative signal transduction protein with domain [Deltaproteobacteria bacterium]